MELKPGYKQTEGGVIPEEWKLERLGDVADIVSGGTPRTNVPAYWDGEIKWCTPTDITGTNGKYLSKTERSITRAGLHSCAAQLLPPGALLLCSRATIGDLKIAACEVCTNQGFKSLLAHDGVNNEYLYYLLLTMKSHLVARAIGSTFLEISKKDTAALQILLPLLSEQRTIAAVLSDVDALIGALDRLIVKKRDLKQAAMQQLITGQTRLPGFSGEWEVLSMVEKSTLKARIGWQGLTTEEYLPTGEYYLVTGTDFLNGRVNWTSCCFVDASRYVQDRNIQLKVGDILLTKDGTIGKVGFVESLPGPATLNSGVFVIRPKGDAYDPLFFYYILTSRVFSNFLAQLQAGSTISHLYQKDFVNFSYRAPSVVEQTAIAAVLSDMDAEIAALETRRDKTRALKQGMMQELLTGRIRLVQDSMATGSKKESESAKASHNWAFNEAVVISALVGKFGSKKYPLGRMRYTKLTYLMHRHVENKTEDYLKKAAGPYNPANRYKGPETIAQKRGYMEIAASGNFSGFAPSRNIDQARAYFKQWYGQEVLEWLEQFRYEKNENLELLATVDMAIQDLQIAGREVTVGTVKDLLFAHDEWRPKLMRQIFSDTHIEQAIVRCKALFGDVQR